MSADAIDPSSETGFASVAVHEAPTFDLVGVQNPSFAVLEDGRAQVYSSPAQLRAFRDRVQGLKTTGEDGRRKGFGMWMIGEYTACAEQLKAYESDDVAAFTRAQALLALGRFAEAAPIFARLSKAYPEEPRPRAGHILAELEAGLAAQGDPERVLVGLRKLLQAAPASFHETVEGQYIAGRLAEAAQDLQAAVEHYAAGFEIDPAQFQNTYRAAHLAERCGLDEEAVRFYEALVHQRPIDERVLINLGVLYEDLGRDQDAASCYDIVLQNRPADRRTRLYLEDAKAGMQMYYDEDQERKEDRLNQILRIPITDFELSVRARNCLNKMQIQTLGDLVCRTEQELLSYKNFGETSLTEIKEILHSKGLRLGMPREEAVASIEAHARRSSTGDQSDVMNRPIMDLQLSIRARRTVEALGCLTAGDVTKHSAEELLGMPNFGQTSLQELRSVLNELGLKLKGE
jgi:DNA-directed RNA polymerase subunit alpha